jgi:O-antigen/teichoic acid export membrane protein
LLTTAAADLKGQVVSGVRWKLATQLVVQVTRTGVGILLAHLLVPRDFGLAAMALIFTGLASIFTDLSLGAALIQRETLTERDRSTAFWATVAAGAICTGVGIAAAPLVADVFSTPAVASLFTLASVTFLLSAVSATQTALLTRELQFRSLQLREIAGLLVGAVAAVVVAVAGGGAWAILVQVLAAEAVSMVLVWRFSRWRPKAMFSWAAVRELGSFGGQTAAARTLGYLNLNADNFLVGKFAGANALGVYALAYNIMFAPLARVAAPIHQVLFPAFSRMQTEPPRVGAAWLRGNRLVAAISVPAFTGLAVVAPDFVPVVLGDRWHEVVPVLQLLCIAGVAQSLQSLNWSVLQAFGRVGSLLRFMLFSTSLTVGAFAIGVHWGVVGVAAGFAIARGAILPVFTVMTCRASRTPISAYLRSVRPILEVSLGMTAVVYAVRLVLSEGGVSAGPRLAILMLLGAASYLGALLWRDPGLLADARSLGPRRPRPERRSSTID